MKDVIVLGAARSGTKFLRDTLAASSSLWRVPYDMNFVWRTGNEGWPDDALPVDSCTDRVAEQIRRGLRRSAGLRDNGAGQRMIEKSVSNTVRLPFVARVFPDANYVHLIRDGREVLASSMRQWLLPTDWKYLIQKARSFPLTNYRYALWYMANRLRFGRKARPVWGVRYPGIEQDLETRSIAEICALQWVHSVTEVRRTVAALPGLHVCEIRYEALVAGMTELNDLVQWLELPDPEQVLAFYQDHLEERGGQSWSAGLSDRDAAAALEIIGPLQAELGYR